jgi:type IV secretion system protein VirD4
VFLGVYQADIKKDAATGELFAQGGVQVGTALKEDRHIMTIAGSRAGKGRAAIIPNMLRYPGSVLAIDPKGELALATAETRANKLGQQVCVIDPFGLNDGKLPITYFSGFNPMAGMTKKTAIEDASLITDALVVAGGGDPHWDESARTFIEGVILEVATAKRFEERRDLVTVRDLIAMGDLSEDAAEFLDDETAGPMDLLREFMAASEEPAVRRAAADFFDRPERERGSVLSTVRRHLRALSFPQIEASLRGGGVKLADLKTTPMTVYLCLPGRHMGTCGRWLRLFINLTLQAMEGTEGKPEKPVLFLLDEFASLGHMKQIEDAAGQIAGFGVKLWPILQDLGQLKALYKDRWETFMGNAGVLQFFGNNDLTTLEWVSKRLGSTTIEVMAQSITTAEQEKTGARGESYSTQTVKVMEVEELALTFGRADRLQRQLIIPADGHPMILQRAYYDQHDAFKGLRPREQP